MLQNNAVTTAKIDYDTGVWWEELGRTTLSSASAGINVSSLPNRKYLKVIILFSGFTATATGINFRVNNDYGANYNWTRAILGASYSRDSQAPSSLIPLLSSSGWPASNSIEVDINNSSSLKTFKSNVSMISSSGPSGISVIHTLISGSWTNANAISTINLAIAGASFATGSEVIVLGHN